MTAQSFASRLTALREQAGLSQYELAKRTGLTRQTLSRLEMGESVPSWPTVQLLAVALDVDFSAFADPDLQLPTEERPRPRGRPKKADTASTDQAESESLPSTSAKSTAGGQSETPKAKKGKKK